MDDLTMSGRPSAGAPFTARMRSTLAEVWTRALPHRLPIYRLAIAVFLLSTLIDTGSDERKGPLGLTVPMVAMILVVIIGLPLWRAPRDRVVWGCLLLIGGWVWAQVLSGQTLRGGLILMSVIVVALIVGGVKASPALFWYQIRLLCLGPFMAGLAFYLGSWKTTWTGRQTFLEFNGNALAYFLAVGFTIGWALTFHVKKPFRIPMLLATLLLLPPLWYTGSRSGLALSVIVTVLFLGIRAGRTWLAMSGVGVVLLAGVLLVSSFDSVLPDSSADSAVLRRFSPTEMAHGETLRFALILSGLEAFAQKPWTGHGFDAPRSLQWRANNLAYTNPDDTGVATHNGYVDYLIMGGVPLCAVFLVLHLWVGWRLWSARGVRTVEARELCALALCLYMYFLAYVGLGDSNSKLGWWSFGFGLQILSVYAGPGAASARSMTKFRTAE